MAKIICVTSGLTGILNASFEVVERLSRRGHEVICAAPVDIADKAFAQGILYKVLPPLKCNTSPALPKFKGPLKKISMLAYLLKNISKRRKKALEVTDPHYFVDLIKEYKPDLLILDIELHEYIIKAYALEIPFVLLSQWFSIWRRPALPYLLSETIPGEGLEGTRFMMQYNWLKVKVNRWMKFSRIGLYSGFTDRRSILLAFAKDEKFPSKYIGENYWPGPFLYNNLPVISMTEESLEFPHNKRPELYYAGPVVNANRKDKPAETVNDYTLEDAFQYAKEENKLIIYCSVSTMQKGDATFLKKVIRAVKSEKKWVLILSVGKLIPEQELGQLAPNIFTFSKVPQLKVLSKADCSINHGGIHTINECIHFKVPMLLYSGKHADQNGCAARIAFHQLGIRGDKDQDDHLMISKKVRTVLEDTIYRKNISLINKQYIKHIEDCRLEKLIERFL
jgi:UDP:flavonoid glycosyltransferase YjiC (YdhE family)